MGCGAPENTGLTYTRLVSSRAAPKATRSAESWLPLMANTGRPRAASWVRNQSSSRTASAGGTAYYTVTANVTVTDDVLPGMQASVSIPQEEAVDAVILDKDALSFDETNRAYVLMRGDSGDMERVYVELGVDNDNYVEIVSGLSDGDTVYVVEEAREEGAASLISILFGGGMSGGTASGGRNFPGEGGAPNFESFGGGGAMRGGFPGER